jgi:hypothetical protein
MSDCGHLALIASGEGCGLCVLCQRAEIERLRAALRDMIEISTRNSEAMLMLIGIRKCAEHALEQKP